MNVKFDFTGKVFVITGAATGLGRETALQFAKAGANVAVLDFDDVKGQQTSNDIKELGAKSIFCKVDVRDIAQIEAAREAIISEFGTVDILHSNAGVAPIENLGPPLENLPDSDWEKIFGINVFGMVKVTRTFLNIFKEKKEGKIILTASIAAYLPGPIMPNYGASKAACVHFTQSLAGEMGPYNVNVNAVCPGYIYTPIYSKGLASNVGKLRKIDGEDGEEIMNKMASASALKRAQQAIDIANGVMFLASEGAREITGQALIIDSGRIMR